MLFQNHFRKFGQEIPSRRTVLFQLLIKILLRHFSIFVPPLSLGRNIVQRSRYHSHITCIFRIIKRNNFRRYSLKFKRRYRQLTHNKRHRIWHQTKNLSTNQHFGTSQERGKFFHIFFVPQIVLSKKKK